MAIQAKCMVHISVIIIRVDSICSSLSAKMKCHVHALWLEDN
jgi:hypothetical protein